MDIITGYTGTKHVTAENDRDINIGIFGSGSYVLSTGAGLKAEISSNNEIKIRDGVVMHQGCAAAIKKNTYDSLTVVNGSQGMKRIDLIVARYEKQRDTNVESLTLKVLQGKAVESSPTAPAHTTGDIQAGDAIADMPLYEVVIDGLNITEVRKKFQTVEDLASLNSNLIQSGTELVPNANGYFAIKNITFPVPYAEIPNVTATVSNGDNNDSLEANIFSQVGRVSKTGCVLKVCCWNEKLAGSKFKVSWIAVGKREL